MIYYILDAIALIFSILFITSINRYSKILIAIVFFLAMIIFGGLRYQVGADWDSYENINSLITSESLFKTGVEPLYSLLVYITKSIGLNYLFFVFIIFTLSTFLKFYSIYKYSVNFFASILVYFPVQLMAYDMNGIRQGIAISILFCSIKYLMEKKMLKFLAVNIIAIGFHYSAIVFVPFYFLSQIKINRNFIHILLFISIIVGFLFQTLILNYLLPQLGGLESVYADKVLGYSESEAFGTSISFGFSTIHRLVIFYLFYYYYDRILLKEPLKNLLLNAYLFSLIIYFLFSAIEIIGARGSLYFRSMDIFIIASFLTLRRDLSYKLIVLVLIFIYSLSGIYTNLKIPFNGLEPYKNLLSHL